jgi:hypothetical protein
MASIAVPTKTGSDLRQKLLDIMADTMLASAIVADMMTMELGAETPASGVCQEAYSKLAAVYRAAVIRLEETGLHPVPENVPTFAAPQSFH